LKEDWKVKASAETEQRDGNHQVTGPACVGNRSIEAQVEMWRTENRYWPGNPTPKKRKLEAQAESSPK